MKTILFLIGCLLVLTTSWVFTTTQRLVRRLPYSEEQFPSLQSEWKRRPTDLSFMQGIGLISNKVYLVKICWRLACSLKLIHRSQEAKLCKGSISPNWHLAPLFHSYEQQGQVGHSLLYILHKTESDSQYTCVLKHWCCLKYS